MGGNGRQKSLACIRMRVLRQLLFNILFLPLQLQLLAKLSVFRNYSSNEMLGGI